MDNAGRKIEEGERRARKRDENGYNSLFSLIQETVSDCNRLKTAVLIPISSFGNLLLTVPSLSSLYYSKIEWNINSGMEVFQNVGEHNTIGRLLIEWNLHVGTTSNKDCYWDRR